MMTNTLNRHWISILVTACLAGLVTWCATAVLAELQAHEDVRQELNRLTTNELPTNDATMAQFFRSRTHVEGSEAWAAILQQCIVAQSNAGELPVVGQGELPSLIMPEKEWTDEPRVSEFLRFHAPLIAQINSAGEYARPVWLPIEFRGFDTLLVPFDNARAVVRLLELEAEHAAYSGEAQRAFDAIQSQGFAAEALDWHMGMIGELVHLALVHSQYATIQRTLSCELWSEAQLDVLIDQLDNPRVDFAERWRNAISSERSWVLSTLQRGNAISELQPGQSFQALVTLPSSIRDYLQFSATAESLADGGIHTFIDKATALDESLRTEGTFLTSQMAPALESVANALLRSEMLRRLTISGLAVKKYFLVNGEWPTSLNDVRNTGIGPQDLTMPNGQAFKFELQDFGVVLANREPVDDPEQEMFTNESNPRYAVTIANY